MVHDVDAVRVVAVILQHSTCTALSALLFIVSCSSHSLTHSKSQTGHELGLFTEAELGLFILRTLSVNRANSCPACDSLLVKQ
jgi:hypothetical protein